MTDADLRWEIEISRVTNAGEAIAKYATEIMILRRERDLYRRTLRHLHAVAAALAVWSLVATTLWVLK